MTTRLYLDHAATTPVLPEAREAMARGFDAWANPNSPHADGRSARALLEEARKTIAEALGWRHDVIFTSGASEAADADTSLIHAVPAGARQIISHQLDVVGEAGFEPATSCSQSRSATRLRYSPEVPSLRRRA